MSKALGAITKNPHLSSKFCAFDHDYPRTHPHVYAHIPSRKSPSGVSYSSSRCYAASSRPILLSPSSKRPFQRPLLASRDLPCTSFLIASSHLDRLFRFALCGARRAVSNPPIFFVGPSDMQLAPEPHGAIQLASQNGKTTMPSSLTMIQYNLFQAHHRKVLVPICSAMLVASTRCLSSESGEWPWSPGIPLACCLVRRK